MRTRAPAFQDELVASLRTDSLQLILLPTEQCNFRCLYCYEDFLIGKMRPEIVQGVRHLIDKRVTDLRHLAVTWFGGEPLLARPVIEEISEHILARVADRPGLIYTGGMTTNGYLLDPPTVERLAALGVRDYQISLDGPEEFHDSTRVRADGRGSFERIWRNLGLIRDGSAPVNVVLRVHLTMANLPSMPEFLTRIRGTFLDDPRFTVQLKPVERLGGPNDADLEILSEPARHTAIAELQRLLTGDQPPAASSEVCYAARPNSLMIRANGLVGKCTVALADPANIVGRLLPDGSLELDNARLRPWLRGWESGDWAELGCPAAGMPQAPPLLQIRSRGTGTGRADPTQTAARTRAPSGTPGTAQQTTVR